MAVKKAPWQANLGVAFYSGSHQEQRSPVLTGIGYAAIRDFKYDQSAGRATRPSAPAGQYPSPNERSSAIPPDGNCRFRIAGPWNDAGANFDGVFKLSLASHRKHSRTVARGAKHA